MTLSLHSNGSSITGYQCPGPYLSPNKDVCVFPKGIYLQHADIPENNPYKLDPIPCFIPLPPQSYFGLDVRAGERFQSLVPSLDSSNAGILVPKYHTFPEACVEVIMNPPVGFSHWIPKNHQDHPIHSLLMRRTHTDPERVPFSQLSPVEVQIISELQTADAVWYIHRWLWTKDMVFSNDLEKYKQNRDS